MFFVVQTMVWQPSFVCVFSICFLMSLRFIGISGQASMRTHPPDAVKSDVHRHADGPECLLESLFWQCFALAGSSYAAAPADMAAVEVAPADMEAAVQFDTHRRRRCSGAGGHGSCGSRAGEAGRTKIDTVDVCAYAGCFFLLF